MIWVWVVGVVLLVAAGFAATFLPRMRARALRQRTAWSVARAAITSAAVSRDAAADVPAAEELFARAELLAANGGGVAAAEVAAGCAERADLLWREAAR